MKFMIEKGLSIYELNDAIRFIGDEIIGEYVDKIREKIPALTIL